MYGRSVNNLHFFGLQTSKYRIMVSSVVAQIEWCPNMMEAVYETSRKKWIEDNAENIDISKGNAQMNTRVGNENKNS